VAKGTFTAGSVASELGQLTRPLLFSQVAGVWLGPDYRVPIPSGRMDTVTVVAMVLVAIAVAIAIVWLLRRREAGPLLYLVPALVTLAILAPRVSPYADAKMLAILSPGVVLVAGCGVLALGRWLLPVGAVVAVALAAAVLASDGYSYYSVKIAPTDRMKAIEDVGHRFHGRGMLLVNEFEEFFKYFGRDSQLNVSTENLTPAQIKRRRTPTPFYGHYYDLDDQLLSYIERFPYLVLRHSPSASRPPINYRLVYSNRWYEVWKRESTPTVLKHFPMQGMTYAIGALSCRDAARFSRVRGARTWIVAATGPDTVQFDTAGAADRSPGWLLAPEPGYLAPAARGFARGSVVTAPGRYRVWLRGTFGRDIDVYVDGRRVGEAREVDTPDQWTDLGTLNLGAGSHRVELRRPPKRLSPGDGAPSRLGRLAFERTGTRGAIWVRPRDVRRLCGDEVDWVEVARK
jgi:hypothetical protein